jgi:hypothetical protein
VLTDGRVCGVPAPNRAPVRGSSTLVAQDLWRLGVRSVFVQQDVFPVSGGLFTHLLC